MWLQSIDKARFGWCQVKAAAAVLVANNDEDGVAEAIERFVL